MHGRMLSHTTLAIYLSMFSQSPLDVLASEVPMFGIL